MLSTGATRSSARRSSLTVPADPKRAIGPKRNDAVAPGGHRAPGRERRHGDRRHTHKETGRASGAQKRAEEAQQTQGRSRSVERQPKHTTRHGASVWSTSRAPSRLRAGMPEPGGSRAGAGCATRATTRLRVWFEGTRWASRRGHRRKRPCRSTRRPGATRWSTPTVGEVARTGHLDRDRH